MRGMQLLVLTVALALAAAALADALSELPPAWADRLLALPEQNLAGVDADQAQRLRRTRGELSAALGESEGPGRELAPGFGRLAALYAAQGLWTAAEVGFDNARRLDPEAFRWAYYGAHLALDAGEAEQALARLEQARALDGDYPTLDLRAGEALLGLNRLTEAERAYLTALETHPEQGAAALYGLAQIDLLQRRWQSAADRLTEVLALQPDADAARYGLGQALLRLGQRERAQRQLAERGSRRPVYPDALVEELASLQGGARHRFEQAMIAVDEQDLDRARGAFEQGLQEAPDNARARASYARVLWLLGEQDKAVDELRRSAQTDPAETLSRFFLAAIADQAGQTDSAAQGYREVLEIDPLHQGALGYLANLELRRGHPAAAAEWFRQVIELDTDQPTLRLHYWRALVESGAPPAQQLEALERFDQRFPEPPIFRLLLARLLATSAAPGVRDTERALQLAAELINSMPIAPHQELLALALAAQGEWEQAVERQSLLVEHALQAGAVGAAAALEDDLQAYRQRRLPTTQWRLDQPMFQPLEVDVSVLMRHYPAPRPF